MEFLFCGKCVKKGRRESGKVLGNSKSGLNTWPQVVGIGPTPPFPVAANEYLVLTSK